MIDLLGKKKQETRAIRLAIFALMLASPAVVNAQGSRTDGHCSTSGSDFASTAEITADEICQTIRFLAADSLEGRGAGEPGAEMAMTYLADRFATIGLASPEGGYIQPFSFPAALRRDPHAPTDPHSPSQDEMDLVDTANIVGILAGSDPDVRNQAIVVGAHYDHLGFGGMGSLTPDEQAIHNGADDNASGVAGLLELAEVFADDRPRRTLVFIAFGAEELGNVGSQYYVNHPVWPLEETVAMVNLDMVGRLREKLTINGTGTSAAWPALIDSLEQLAGSPEIARVPDGFGPSDHSSFYGVQVPVLAFFTGAHEQYHRPSDDVDTIDAAGEVTVLTVAEAAIRSVANRDDRVAYTEAPITQRRATPFKVGLGVIPDYAYGGEGLLLSAVRPGGPAAGAELEAGDVIKSLAGQPIGDIYAYTAILAELEAGVPIELVYERDGETVTTTVTPEARNVEQ